MSNILPGGRGVPQGRCPDYGAKLRDAVLSVLNTGREWGKQADTVLAPMLLASPLKLAGKQNVTPYGEATRMFRQALVQGQYFLTDADMTAILKRLVVKHVELADMVQQLVAAVRDENGQVGPGLRDRAFDIPAGADRLLDELHRLSIERLGVGTSALGGRVQRSAEAPGQAGASTSSGPAD